MWFLPLRNDHRLPILGLYCNGRAGVRLGPESEAEKLREKDMGKVFNDLVEKAVTDAAACRIAVYPRQHGWVSERVQLELADSQAQLGETTPSRGGGHYLVDGITAEEAAKEARRLRGKPVEIVRIE